EASRPHRGGPRRRLWARGGRLARRGRADRHRRVRGEERPRQARAGRQRRGDGHAAAPAQREGHDAVRRRVRAVDRRSARRPAGRPTRGLVLLRQRCPRRQGCVGDRGPRRRPRLVGPPRLGRDEQGRGGRRLVPGAVRARPRRRAAVDADRVRRDGRRRLRPRAEAAERPRPRGRQVAARERRGLGVAAHRRRALGRDPRRSRGRAARAGTEGQRRLRPRRRGRHDRGAGRAGPRGAPAGGRRRARRRDPLARGAADVDRHRPRRRRRRGGRTHVLRADAARPLRRRRRGRPARGPAGGGAV
ncbi:MAG: hypothetical protein AVDCRST_MAG85-3746, partial [uncultured Solirubrobacteraceae bacterium]